MPKTSKNGGKVPLFRCKYGHTRCKGGEPCERAMAKTGRPTDWTPEMNDALVEYFLAKAANREFPFFGAFEREHKLTHGSLSLWAKPEAKKRYPGFYDAYNAAKEIQKEHLIAGALGGAYNPTFSIFTAKNITDMRDQKEIGGIGGGPLRVYWADEVDEEEAGAMDGEPE